MEREKPNEINETQIDFIRHGETDYVENLPTSEKETLLETPIDLTELGIEQVQKVAAEIVDRIDPERELVILWSSPAWRAQGSESIVMDLLEKKGIEVYKKSLIQSMAPISHVSVDSEDQNADEVVRDNAGRVFNWLRYLTEKANTEGKMVHIIGVSHHEFLNPIREDLFPHDVPSGKGFEKGESVKVNFVFNKQTDEFSISAEMRGMKVDDIVFDKDSRKFVSPRNREE